MPPRFLVTSAVDELAREGRIDETLFAALLPDASPHSVEVRALAAAFEIANVRLRPGRLRLRRQLSSERPWLHPLAIALVVGSCVFPVLIGVTRRGMPDFETSLFGAFLLVRF